MELNKIIQGDSFELIKTIPEKSINFVLTDPPYDLDWKGTIKFKDRKDIYHHGDDTKKWDNKLASKELYEKLFPELRRVIVDNGGVIMFCRVENISFCKEAANANGFEWKATICWTKTNPAIQIRKKNYLSSFEMMGWMAPFDAEGVKYTFNFSKQNEMHNVISGPICMGNERLDHPTQKPLYLLNKLLMVHSNPGDIILDLFSGSGSTAEACLKLGRKFVGFEVEQKYVDMANSRIKHYLEQGDLL